MEISYSHRFIFVHVPRAGGQSVSAALAPYSYVPPRLLARLPVVRDIGRNRIGPLRDRHWGHIKAKELRAALPEEFGDFYKFTFVRNVWEWHVSTYNYVLQRTDHPDRELFESLRTFERYLDWRIDVRGAEQQREFVLSDDGELLVDFVGHNETLAEDFATVCERVGIDASLPHKNRSSHTDYTDYYTPATRELVAEAWKGDIEYFGFEFGGPQRLEPILGPKEAERLSARA